MKGYYVQSAWGDPMRKCSWILLWKTTTHKTGLTVNSIQHNHWYKCPMFRPVLNESMPIDITFGINLQQIVDLVTKLHKFSQKTFNAIKKFKFKWYPERKVETVVNDFPSPPLRMKRTNCWQHACGFNWWVLTLIITLTIFGYNWSVITFNLVWFF